MPFFKGFQNLHGFRFIFLSGNLTLLQNSGNPTKRSHIQLLIYKAFRDKIGYFTPLLIGEEIIEFLLSSTLSFLSYV